MWKLRVGFQNAELDCDYCGIIIQYNLKNAVISISSKDQSVLQNMLLE